MMRACRYVILIVCPLVAAAFFLAGCGSTPQEHVVTQTVNVPVPVHCNPKIETTVVYPDSDDAMRTAANLFERTKLLLAGRDIRMARIQELEAALKGCE